MMKKVTKVQQYAVLHLHSLGRTSADIASELKIENSQVLDIINSHNTTNIQPQNLMITQTATKKGNVAIMTKEASELSDAMKHKTHTTSRHANNIFRPKNK